MMSSVQRWVVYTNNYCNLSCVKCNTGCDKPYGSTPFRESKYDIPLNELELLLMRLPLNTEIRLVGGETTAMSLSTLVALFDLIHEYNCTVSLLTNGYRLRRLLCEDLFSANDSVTLDNHGVNENMIQNCVHDLQRRNIMYEVIDTLIHYDLESAIPYSQGLRCDQWFTKPSLYDGVIYPCCSMMTLKGGMRDTWGTLKELGWTVYNPSWYELFLGAVLPPSIHHRCLYECFLPNLKMGVPHKLY